MICYDLSCICCVIYMYLGFSHVLGWTQGEYVNYIQGEYMFCIQGEYMKCMQGRYMYMYNVPSYSLG
jgi:hypothetical protein